MYLKRYPVTLSLIAANVAVFAWQFVKASGFDEPSWSWNMLHSGGLFNPFVMEGQWYRIFSSMFMHAHIPHILLNMIALYSIGSELEPKTGHIKFLVVYLICGIGCALAGLYFELFQNMVGASGAIFGLIGFQLIGDIYSLRQDKRSLMPLIINFIIFLGLNIVVGMYASVSHYGHGGGLLTGIALGLFTFGLKPEAPWVSEVVVAAILAFGIIMLPTYQLEYFRFFKGLIAAEDSVRSVGVNSRNKSAMGFADDYEKVIPLWDTALHKLHDISFVPEKLQSDTFKHRRYLSWHAIEAKHRLHMIRNESYIYMDSINAAQDSSSKYTKLTYFLPVRYPSADTATREEQSHLLPSRVLYDSNWVETPTEPFSFYRLGMRDSLGQWQGPVVDYFANGQPQMKGSYEDDLKSGIFIYYTDRSTYQAAGLYDQDYRVGKWETFHPNGKIESEVYYNDGYYLKSYWDSTGVQMVANGNGREIHRYPNGVIGTEGEYRDGKQEGYWYGKHPDGKMYFEENYVKGILARGRSVSKDGRVFVYDESSFLAIPEVGPTRFNNYIEEKVKELGLSEHGVVRLTFRVTVQGQLTDFKVVRTPSEELGKIARQLVLNGPRWLPARLHGQELTDGLGIVQIQF